MKLETIVLEGFSKKPTGIMFTKVLSAGLFMISEVQMNKVIAGDILSLTFQQKSADNDVTLGEGTPKEKKVPTWEVISAERSAGSQIDKKLFETALLVKSNGITKEDLEVTKGLI